MRVWTFQRAIDLINAVDPESLEAAQFSLPFCLAVAVSEGPEALLPMDPKVLRRSDLVGLARRVEMHMDPELDTLFPARTPARVVLKTNRGMVEKRLDVPLGDPKNPMDQAQLETKFRGLAGGRWDPAVLEEVVVSARTLDTGGYERLRPILMGKHPGPPYGA